MFNKNGNCSLRFSFFFAFLCGVKSVMSFFNRLITIKDGQKNRVHLLFPNGDLYCHRGDLYCHRGDVYCRRGDLNCHRGDVYCHQRDLLSPNVSPLFPNINLLFQRGDQLFTRVRFLCQKGIFKISKVLIRSCMTKIIGLLSNYNCNLMILPFTILFINFYMRLP